MSGRCSAGELPSGLSVSSVPTQVPSGLSHLPALPLPPFKFLALLSSTGVALQEGRNGRWGQAGGRRVGLAAAYQQDLLVAPHRTVGLALLESKGTYGPEEY